LRVSSKFGAILDAKSGMAQGASANRSSSSTLARAI
jgi:hypothetical protein